jgi:hypothetical protein
MERHEHIEGWFEEMYWIWLIVSLVFRKVWKQASMIM